jgi:hypothetical protein
MHVPTSSPFVMRERLCHFERAVAAAALHFFRDPEVQHHAPLAQRALINGVKRDEQRKRPER